MFPKRRYETDKAAAAGFVAVDDSYIKLRASLSEATIVNGPQIKRFSSSCRKPGFFILDYNIPKKVIPVS